jgi:uncharacterized coiled-coil protein SlyX
MKNLSNIKSVESKAAFQEKLLEQFVQKSNIVQLKHQLMESLKYFIRLAIPRMYVE